MYSIVQHHNRAVAGRTAAAHLGRRAGRRGREDPALVLNRAFGCIALA
jgi:hypothetical protein